MNQNIIQVVAVVVDSGIITFYKTDGSVFTVTQSDPRGPVLLDAFLLQRQQGKEVIDLQIEADDKVTALLNPKKRNPLIRFFKARVEDVAKVFGIEINHKVKGAEASHEEAAQRVRDIAAKLMKVTSTEEAVAVEELPIRLVDSEDASPLAKGETIIAVTEDGIVPEIESMTEQFKASDEGTASATGPDNLILRLSKMSAKRGHTAQELMRFIKGIDLPILPDGSFLAYKRLLHKGNGVYVDPHSKKVFQRIGDTVRMDEKLVDPNRRTLCSTGLHIGTRHYMGGFHANSAGSGTMLVLVEPEHAIAVPQNESSKGRVMQYTLLCDLSDKAHNLVNGKKRMDDCKDTMEVVAQIVAGARPPMLGIVNIGGEYGSDLTYTINGVGQKVDMSLDEARFVANSKATAPTAPVKTVKTIDDTAQGNKAGLVPEKVREKSAVVKPTEVQAKAVAQAPVKGASERVKKAKALYAVMTDKNYNDERRRQAALDLKEFKQKAKVGYAVLGVPADTGKEIQEILDLTEPSKKAPTPKPAKPASAPAKKQPEPKKQAPVAAPQPAAQSETRQEKARRLWANASNENLSGNHRKQAAEELRKLKKATKVGWSALDLGNFDVDKTLKTLLG